MANLKQKERTVWDKYLHAPRLSEVDRLYNLWSTIILRITRG